MITTTIITRLIYFLPCLSMPSVVSEHFFTQVKTNTFVRLQQGSETLKSVNISVLLRIDEKLSL